MNHGFAYLQQVTAREQALQHLRPFVLDGAVRLLYDHYGLSLVACELLEGADFTTVAALLRPDDEALVAIGLGPESIKQLDIVLTGVGLRRDCKQR
jgi:hypothetical protein